MGKYTVSRELYSHGNYITAYEAIQEGLGKRVEIRVLQQNIKDQSKELARFQVEIRNLSILDHPSILRVLDCGIINGKLYYVTEAKPGITTSQWLSSSPTPSLDDKLKITTQIAGALRYMHGKGLIHRGINDTAVNFDPDLGLAYVSQFFFLKNMRTDDLTIRGIGPIFSMLATPEGILEQPLDARTDVFMLGALLFKMLTGADAYSSDFFLGMTPDKVTGSPPRRPKDLDPQIPVPVDAVVARAIALPPEKRYQTAQDFADAIADAQKKVKIGRRAPGKGMGATLDGASPPPPGAPVTTSTVSRKRGLLASQHGVCSSLSAENAADTKTPAAPSLSKRSQIKEFLADRQKLWMALLQEKEKLKLWGGVALGLFVLFVFLLWFVLLR